MELHPFAHVPHERRRVHLLVAGGAVHREDALADLEVQQVAKDLVDDLLVVGVEDGRVVAHVFRRLPGAVGATASRAFRFRFRDRFFLGLGLGLGLRSLRGCRRGNRRCGVVVIVVATAGEDGGGARRGHAGAGQEAPAAQLSPTESKPVVISISHLVPPARHDRQRCLVMPRHDTPSREREAMRRGKSLESDAPAQAGVERIPNGIAEDVEGEHGDGQRSPGEDGDPGRAIEELA